MHYANMRPAKNGDKVLQVMGKQVVVGVLYDAVAGNDYCNGMLAPLSGGPHVGACLADCVLLGDALHALGLPDVMSNMVTTTGGYIDTRLLLKMIARFPD
jgi:hypothetical protein